MMFLPGTRNAIVLLVATTMALSPWESHGFSSPLNRVVVPTPKRHLVAVAAVDPFGGDQGWDNDDFLDALSSSSSSSSSDSSSAGGGGGPDYEKLESANAKYYQKSKGRLEMRQRVFEKKFGNGDNDDNDDESKGDNEAARFKYVPKEDEEEGQGGQMFKRMMERAEELKKNGGARRPAPVPRAASQPQQQTEPHPVPQQQQQEIVPPPVVPVGQVGQAPTDPQEYYLMQLQAWQQQVASYAQFAASNPEAAAAMTMPPPPLPPLQSLTTQSQVPQTQTQTQAVATPITPTPPTQQQQQQQPSPTNNTKKDPRDYLPPAPPGRSADAYEVANSSDVYLAQLKRDSAVRKWAREDGDIESANTPMVEEGVRAIGTLLGGELAEKRKEQARALKENYKWLEQEMWYEKGQGQGDGNEMVAGTGQLSYRKKLEAAKRKRMGLADPDDPPLSEAPFS